MKEKLKKEIKTYIGEILKTPTNILVSKDYKLTEITDNIISKIDEFIEYYNFLYNHVPECEWVIEEENKKYKLYYFDDEIESDYILEYNIKDKLWHCQVEYISPEDRSIYSTVFNSTLFENLNIAKNAVEWEIGIRK